MTASVRFIRRDGKPDEIYLYSSPEDAADHMDLFRNDDSGLYRAVVYTEMETGNVLDVITFE